VAKTSWLSASEGCGTVLIHVKFTVGYHRGIVSPFADTYTLASISSQATSHAHGTADIWKSVIIIHI